MKNLSIILLASVLFTACNKENQIDSSSEPGTPAALVVKLAGSTNSKAAGAPTDANESKIGKGIIFVFRGTGSNPVLDGKATFDFTSANPTAITVPMTAGASRHVYAIANVPDLTVFDNVSKVSDLYNIGSKFNLSWMRTGTNLGMSGHRDNIDASNATTASPAAIVVQLNYLGSRIHVDWDVTQLPPSMTGFSVTGAYLLNVKERSDYFSAPPTYLTTNVNAYLRGKDDVTAFSSGAYFPNVTATHTYDNNLMVGNLAADKGFANNYFYVLENNTTAPTMVVIEGVHNSVTYYYPIVINGDQNGSGIGGATNGGDKSSAITRGNIYQVKAIIKGFGNSAPNGPYHPLTKAAINVTITPASWNPVINIDQEFN